MPISRGSTEVRMENIIRRFNSHGEDGEDTEQLLEAAYYFMELCEQLDKENSELQDSLDNMETV